MDNYQYRLLQLSIPTRTDKKEQEAFLREIFEKHVPMIMPMTPIIATIANTSSNALLLFKEAWLAYNVELPQYIVATVLARANAQNLYAHFD